MQCGCAIFFIKKSTKQEIKLFILVVVVNFLLKVSAVLRAIVINTRLKIRRFLMIFGPDRVINLLVSFVQGISEMTNWVVIWLVVSAREIFDEIVWRVIPCAECFRPHSGLMVLIGKSVLKPGLVLKLVKLSGLDLNSGMVPIPGLVLGTIRRWFVVVFGSDGVRLESGWAETWKYLI